MNVEMNPALTARAASTVSSRRRGARGDARKNLRLDLRPYQLPG
jgi:hypothetical protein